jgi:hypothetical protein
MGDEYTIDEFSALSAPRQARHLWECFKFTPAPESRPSESHSACR